MNNTASAKRHRGKSVKNALVESRLCSLYLFRHAGMNNFTQRVSVQRRAAVVAIFGFKTMRMPPDLVNARLPYLYKISQTSPLLPHPTARQCHAALQHCRAG